MPWGTGPWGTGSWGSGGDPAALVTAYAISMNEVLVTASAPLLQRSIVLAGDSSNPSTWYIIRNDTSELLQIVAATPQSPTQVVLRTLFPIPGFNVEMTVAAPNGLDSLGGPIAAPRMLSFFGLTEEAYSTPEKTATALTQSAVDLLNRQTQGPDGSLTGTLVIKSGDYANQSGNDLLRKLITRRLIATPGDFFHLPTYGVGLKVKQPLPGGDLIKLKAQIQKQIALEPEVDNVSVSLLQSANVLTVQVSVTVKATGERLDANVPFPVQGG
jgi:hypothetical protein